PVAAYPLAGLCWLVLFLAVGYGVAARRQEVGAVAVRGAPGRTRVAMVTLECLLPVLLGVPLGIALAHLLGGLAGPAQARPAPPASRWPAAWWRCCWRRGGNSPPRSRSCCAGCHRAAARSPSPARCWWWGSPWR